MKPQNDSSLTSGESRRSFIKKTATLAAAASATGSLITPIYGQDQAPSANVTGANNRLVLGIVGTGGQGSNHIRTIKAHAEQNNVQFAAVCDLYQKRLDAAQKATGVPDDSAYRDHRKLLERKDIDAIFVTTVDNWHADVTMDALNAGKHVYCEKPMSRYLQEGWDVHDTVKKTGKVYSCGSQYTADPQVHKAAEWIKAGKIGPLVWAQGSYCRNNPNNSEWTFPVDKDATPDNLDWERWQGRAPKIPWTPEHYFCWHKYYTYNSGLLGNLLSHRVFPMLMATGNPEFPVRVCCTGTRKISTDREITDTTHVLAEYPSGLTLVLAGSTVNEQGLPDILRGRKATLYFPTSQNKLDLKPERPFADELDPETFDDPLSVGDISRLEKNFFDCIRSGATPYCNIDLAVRVITTLGLAEMSERMGLTLFFDENTRTIKTADGKVVPTLTYGTVIERNV